MVFRHRKFDTAFEVHLKSTEKKKQKQMLDGHQTLCAFQKDEAKVTLVKCFYSFSKDYCSLTTIVDESHKHTV